MTEYQQKVIDNKEKAVQELNKFEFKWKLIVNKNDAYMSTIQLVGNTPITVSLNEYTGYYHFYLNHKLPYVKFYTQKEVEEKLEKPKNIRVLTNNKIKAQVGFLTEVYNQLVFLSNERVLKIEAFKKEIESLTGEKTISKIEPYNLTFSGSIVKNGIQFNFQVYDEGYISKKIEIYYKVGNNIEDFEKLSNNEWVKNN